MVRLFVARFLLGAAEPAIELVRSGTSMCRMVEFRFKEGEKACRLCLEVKRTKADRNRRVEIFE